MSNNIGSFSPGQFNPYRRVQDSSSTPSPSSPEQSSRVHENAAAPPSPEAQQAQGTGQTPALSQAEEAMIQREFPENKDLSMRLYGPNRSTQNVAPDTLGNNLDVRG